MIQLNLLPDVKLEYLHAERSRRLTIGISILVALAAIGLLIVLLAIDGVQYATIKGASSQINKESAQLQSQPNIGTVLTVQNQLESLTDLHNKKPAAARLFTYLNEVTPNQANISTLSIDFTQQTITLTGAADSLATVNQYVDTLKVTGYKAGSNTGKAFNNIVLGNFNLSAGDATTPNAKPASYTIAMQYDPNIFDTTQDVKLVVPSGVTTRPSVQQPNDLFQTNASSAPAGGSH